MYPVNILGVQSTLVVSSAYARQHPEVEQVVGWLVDGIGFRPCAGE